MTTTIIITTHDWPARVEINDQYQSSGKWSREWRHGNRTEFVPAHSEQSYAITDSRSISFYELPKDATDLDCFDGTQTASAATGSRTLPENDYALTDDTNGTAQTD